MYIHRWLLIGMMVAAVLCIGYGVREAAADGDTQQLPFDVPEYPEPEDNAWDYIVQAAEVLEETDGSRGSDLVYQNNELGAMPNYAAAAACYEATFEVLRMGLYNECRVPDVTDFNQLFPELKGCREMARGLSYEARAYFAIGQPDKGVESIQDCLRLGRNITINGTLIHSLVSIAVEAIGADALVDGIRQQRPSAEKLIAFVEWNGQDRKTRQSAADTLAVEAKTAIGPAVSAPKPQGYPDYMRRVIEWAGQPVHLRGDVPHYPGPADVGVHPDTYSRCVEKIAVAEAVRRGLSVVCAIEAYMAREGQYPGSLEALSPDYITTVPLDPFSGENFVYVAPRDGDDTYLLYSIGPDMVDDFAVWAWNGQTRDGDLLLGPEWQIYGYRDPAGVPGPPPGPAPPPAEAPPPPPG